MVESNRHVPPKPKAGDRVKGILTVERGSPFLEDAAGVRHLRSEKIWAGYVQHWTGVAVRARRLPQRDYESGRPIVLLAPEVCRPAARPYVALYYNERLAGYPASLFGHVAIDVDGTVFNFSHLLNEDEAITLEEFLYRPPLGEFSPHPDTGRFNVDDPERPYYHKFGRLFMRTVHALIVEGLDTQALAAIFHSEMDAIHATPRDARRPEKYRDFGLLRRSCVTVVRDGLRGAGLPGVRGILPRELFVSAAHRFFEEQRRGRLAVSLRTLAQLKVPEASHSAMTPLFNPANRVRAYRLKREFRVDV